MAFFISIMATPFVRALALKYNVVDRPNLRKIHKKLVPRWGGLAIFLGFFLAILIAQLIYGDIINKQIAVSIFGGVLILGLGALDDIYSVKAPIKLFVELLVAIMVVSSGIKIDFINIPFSVQNINMGMLGPFISVFWILMLINTMNLIDGLDGLASGIAAISALSLFFISLILKQTFASAMLIALAGAALGFLRFNFNPASIFMGDTGSLFLGYLLAVCSIQGVLKSSLAISLAIPILSLLVPIADTWLAIRRRLKNKKHIFKADAEHIHHKLLGNGYSHKQAVIVLYFFSSILNVAAILLALSSGIWSILLGLIVLFIVVRGFNQVRRYFSL